MIKVSLRAANRGVRTIVACGINSARANSCSPPPNQNHRREDGEQGIVQAIPPAPNTPMQLDDERKGLSHAA